MDCLHCNQGICLASVPIFQSLNQKEVLELSRHIIHKQYKKGEAIFLAGDINHNLFVVRKGKVKITRLSERGREQVIRLIQAGDFFGELSLFRNSPIHTNAEAVETTEVCLLEGSVFKQVLEKTPDILFDFLNQLSERLEKAKLQLSQLSSKDVGQRLAGYLLQCAEDNQNQVFEFPVNKTDAASMLGTSRETLSRKLSFFQQKGYIKLSGRQIQICNPDALQALL